MMEALRDLMCVIGFLSIFAGSICIVIGIFQLIFNKEAREDWLSIYLYCKEICSDFKKCVLLAVYRKIKKALLAMERRG